MSQTFTLTAATTLVTEECCECHTVFAMSAELKQQRLNDHKSFYCPAGHGQRYTGKSEAERLKEQLAEKERHLQVAREMRDGANRRADAAERKAAAHKGVATKLKKRVANGVCPCCNRQFANLHRHMAGQHPDFVQDLE